MYGAITVYVYSSEKKPSSGANFAFNPLKNCSPGTINLAFNGVWFLLIIVSLQAFLFMVSERETVSALGALLRPIVPDSLVDLMDGVVNIMLALWALILCRLSTLGESGDMSV
jgi:hypothetical protein